MNRSKRIVRWSAAVAAAAAATAAALFAIPAVHAAESEKPFQQFYVPTDIKAVNAVRRAEQVPSTDVRNRRLAISSMITSQPSAIWYSDFQRYSVARVQDLAYADVTAAKNASRAPVIVPYMIPFRDCANVSEGGAPDIDTWRLWISRLNAGLTAAISANYHADFRVFIMLEPDAVALQSGDQGCVDKAGAPVTFDVAARNQALQYAVRSLRQAGCVGPGIPADCSVGQSKVKVFLDAGHSLWYGSDSGVLAIANRLKAAGIEWAAGFYTNASNYQPTDKEITYGAKLRAKLGNSVLWQFIDTSRNGTAIPSGRQTDTGWPDWCDPTGARLGDAPALDRRAAANGALTSYMWIKPPGETDGCYGGSNTRNSGGRDGRGVPDNGYLPGTFSNLLACRLITGDGSSGGCAVDMTVKPPRPSGLRMASYWVAQYGGVDALLLSWNPSYGACAYQILRRINGSGNFKTIKTLGGSAEGVGPPTSYVLAGAELPRGAKVEYTLRSRACAEAANYSSTGNIISVTLFP